MEHAIARLRAPEVATRLAAGAALILPMGSTETHGPAAPMGDYLLAEAIAMQAARALAVQGDDALVAPGIAFGGEDFFAGVPGAIALSPATLTALTLECLEALHRGAPGARLLVVNGHGGNIASIDTAQRAMRARHGVVLPHSARLGSAICFTQPMPFCAITQSLGVCGSSWKKSAPKCGSISSKMKSTAHPSAVTSAPLSINARRSNWISGPSARNMMSMTRALNGCSIPSLHARRPTTYHAF